MKKLRDPCTQIRIIAGQHFVDQPNSGKFITNDSVSPILTNVQNELNTMAALSIEADDITSDTNEVRDSSADGQTSLGIPDSPADSD